ncbi:hypothetical protein AAKU64_003756 [Undibacterium sp. GrIS 1.8]
MQTNRLTVTRSDLGRCTTQYIVSGHDLAKDQ